MEYIITIIYFLTIQYIILLLINLPIILSIIQWYTNINSIKRNFCPEINSIYINIFQETISRVKINRKITD